MRLLNFYTLWGLKSVCLLVFSLLLFLIPNVASGQSFTKGEFTYEIVSAADKTVRVTDFNQTSTNSYVNNRLIRIPTGVVIDGIFFTVTEISYLFSSLDKNIKTLIIPSTIKKLGNRFYPELADEVFLLTDTPPEGYNTLSGVRNLYIIGGKEFPFGTEMVSVISGQEKIYDGQIPSFSFFSNLVGRAKVSISEPFSSMYKYTSGQHSTQVRFSFTLDNNDNVPGYSDYVTYDPTISYLKTIDYVITPKTLLVSAKNETCQYGDEFDKFSYYKLDGFVNNESLESLGASITLTTEYIKGKDVGEYPIIATIDNANYICNTEGYLKVLKAPLKVSVFDVQRLYGDNNPMFKLRYDGFKLDDSESSSFTQPPIANTVANMKSDVGIYPISATGGECKNYEIIEYNTGTLTITKAPLTLKANDSTRVYGNDNPEFNFSLSGLKNTDDISCIDKKPTYICLATKNSDCGEYDIIPSDAQAKNYEISYQNGTLTVTKAQLTLTADNLSREYGDPNPILSYNAIGLKDGDTVSTAITEEPILSTTANASTGVGQFPISISGGAAKNYSLSYKNGVLTITKAPLSVIADNAERMYGESNPKFTRSYLGFKLNDTETTSFSTLPTITCSASKTSSVGNYTITAKGGTARNYNIVAYEDGILKVTKAPLILTAGNYSRLYFEENPTFDYSLSGLKNSDTKSCLSVKPMFSCTATKTSHVGDYVIETSGASATNYNIEYRPGTLSVNKRQLTASVGNYTRTYGEENPEFEIKYTGFVNNEDKTALSNEATVSCSATKSSDVGTYILNPIGGDAINYTISKYNSGTLTITKADQTLIWNQNLSNIQQYSQIALEATSSAGLPVSYEMSPNNVATLYNNSGIWYIDCFGSGAVNIRASQNGDKNHNAAPILNKTLVVLGSGGDPSNPQIYLNVENAGTLPSLIAENRKYQIKNLRLTGYLNGTDINFLREMAGSDSYGNKTVGILEALDISGCTIVSGGKSYYKSCYTENFKISDYMFYNCQVLINIKLPSNTTTIEDFAFADCDRLSVISIPNDVKSIGNQSFRNDISLVRISLPQSLTTIEDMAFMGCNGISDITIPVNVKSIGNGTFKDCQNISQINIESGNSYFASKDGVLYTHSLGELLIFPANHNSKNYTVIEGTQKIASNAFVNAKNLSNIFLPSSLQSIGQDAFIGCVNLSTITIDALTPPICENDCFEEVSKSRCELRVPKGCYSYYWVAPVWSKFNKLVEYDSGINEVSMDNIDVFVEGSYIIVKGTPLDTYVHIYQMNGLLIYQQRSVGEDISFQPATRGMYMVVIGNKTFKIIVK